MVDERKDMEGKSFSTKSRKNESPDSVEGERTLTNRNQDCSFDKVTSHGRRQIHPDLIRSHRV